MKCKKKGSGIRFDQKVWILQVRLNNAAIFQVCKSVVRSRTDAQALAVCGKLITNGIEPDIVTFTSLLISASCKCT